LTVLFGILLWLARRRFEAPLIELFDALSKHSSYLSLTAAFVIFLGLAFLIAHALDLVSAFLFERLYVDKLHGFPHERIVPFDFTTTRYRMFVRRKFRPAHAWSPYAPLQGAFFSLYVMLLSLLVLALSKIFSVDNFGNQSPVLGSLLLERAIEVALKALLWWSRLSFLYCSAWLALIALPKYTFLASFRSRRVVIRVVWRSWIHLLLCRLGARAFRKADHVIRRVFRLNKEISRETYAGMRKQLRRRFQIDINKVENNDRFWLCYLCLKKASRISAEECDKALKQASFARNQSLALVVSAALLLAATHGRSPTWLSPCAPVSGEISACYGSQIRGADRTADALSKRINSELLTPYDLGRMALVFAIFHFVFLLRYLVSSYHASKILFRAVAMLPASRNARPSSEKPVA